MKFKCCVGGCDATSDTHRLFSVPKNDSFRKLWMYFLVPTNPLLIGLSKEQLIRKRVCEKHFEKQQFHNRKLLRDSYPTLFTESEIKHGEPLSKDRPGQGDHTYSKDPETVDDIEDDNNCNEELVVLGYSGHSDHNYCGNSVAEDSRDTMLLIEKSVVEGPSYSSAKEIGLLAPSITEMVAEEPSSSSKNNILHTSLVDTEMVMREPHSATNLGLPSSLMDTENVSTPSVMLARIQKEKAQKETILSDKGTGSILRKCVTKTRRFMNKIKNKTTTSLGLSSSQRLNEAISCGREKDLIQNFEHLNKQTKAFLIMQLKNCKKNKMARRFSFQEKLLALTIMKQSPKAYKLLENMFALPNKRTLHRLSERVSLEPGCNIKIFQFIERKSKNWDIKEKLCIITFDEIALTPHLIYNEKKDIIHGFVDLDTRHKKFCDHALVFMLRGICSSWRQTITYYFCEGTTPAATVQNLLKQIVKEVAQTGLIPLGLVCDQGSTFRTAIRIMRDDTVHMRNVKGICDDGSVSIAGHDLSVFFDPPHLLKGLRNNFLNKDILWDTKIATWKDIQFIYDIDCKLGHTRALPKLTAQHVDPNKIKKMKVSVAAQVFSNRTAAMLKYTNALNILNSGPAEKNTLETTALVVEFVDQLFDSVNGYPGGAIKGKLRKAVKKNSIHHKFWAEAIQKLKNIKFFDNNSKIAIQTGKCRLVRVPSLEGWITTLKSFQRISKLLFEKFNVEYYYPRNINQDPLENFFGRVRALNFRNINPDANTFVYAYKSLLFSNLLSPHSKMANCEADNGENIIDLNFLFEEEKFDKENELPRNILSTLPTHMSTSQQPSGSSLRNEVISEKIKVQCSAYTAGFICRKMTKSIKCPNCLQTYVSSSENEEIHKYIKYREWKLLKNNNLLYPNEKLLILYRKSSTLIHNFLNNYCHERNIKFNLISNINNNLQFSWLGCSSHAKIIKEVFIRNVVRLHIHNWCNIINKILKGGIEEKYVAKMDMIQKLALVKYKKNKLRKKVLNK